MFAYLRGIVAAKGLDHIQLDVNGVGYEVFVPDIVHRRLKPEQGVTLLTYCNIREDAFQIFGFLRREEKTVFTLLLGVSGIGPKVAIAVLSAMTPQDFGRAVTESDVSAFNRVGGVGKKTAQRIILEMKAKLGQDAELDAILGQDDASSADEDSDDAVAALISLGCVSQEARRLAARARKDLGEDAPDEEVVKKALRSLAKV